MILLSRYKQQVFVNKKNPKALLQFGFLNFVLSENDYIHTTITPILTYLGSSLRKLPNLKAIQKQIIFFSLLKDITFYSLY